VKSISDKQIRWAALIGGLIIAVFVLSALSDQGDVRIHFSNYSRTNNQVVATIQLSNVRHSDVILNPYLTLYHLNNPDVDAVEFVKFMENHKILGAYCKTDISFVLPSNTQSWQAGFGYSLRPSTIVRVYRYIILQLSDSWIPPNDSFSSRLGPIEDCRPYLDSDGANANSK